MGERTSILLPLARQAASLPSFPLLLLFSVTYLLNSIILSGIMYLKCDCLYTILVLLSTGSGYEMLLVSHLEAPL